MFPPCFQPPATIELVATEIAPELRNVLFQLAAARQHAARLCRDEWDFAVEFERLLGDGVTISDLRWLMASGYAVSALEITRSSDTARRFRMQGNLSLRGQACLVLSEAGARFVDLLFQQQETSRLQILNFPTADSAAESYPRWNPDLRVLRVGGTIVKRLNRPAPNQEAIFSAFQEEGWPPRIDDPIPPKTDLVTKCRLRDTIRWLNRNLAPQLLRFYGDGSGEGICWKLLPSAAHDFPPATGRKVRAAA